MTMNKSNTNFSVQRQFNENPQYPSYVLYKLSLVNGELLQ